MGFRKWPVLGGEYLPWYWPVYVALAPAAAGQAGPKCTYNVLNTGGPLWTGAKSNGRHATPVDYIATLLMREYRRATLIASCAPT